MDTTRTMLAYVQAIDGLNRSDFEPMVALLDEKCQWEGVGSNRDGIMAFFKTSKGAGLEGSPHLEPGGGGRLSQFYRP